MDHRTETGFLRDSAVNNVNSPISLEQCYRSEQFGGKEIAIKRGTN